LAISAFIVIVACVLLGHWQLSRVYRPVDGYSAEPAAVPLDTLVGADGAVSPTEVARQVTAAGHYAIEAQRIVPGHSLSGQPVSWVVTPLVLPDHTEVLVVRGWIDAGGQALAAPVAYPVAITGRIEQGSVLPPGSTRTAPATGAPPHLRSGYLVRTAQVPPDPLSLQPVPEPAPRSNAPAEFHLQNAIYVVQWFLLAAIVLVIWWRLRRAMQQAARADGPRQLESVG